MKKIIDILKTYKQFWESCLGQIVMILTFLMLCFFAIMMMEILFSCNSQKDCPDCPKEVILNYKIDSTFVYPNLYEKGNVYINDGKDYEVTFENDCIIFIKPSAETKIIIK